MANQTIKDAISIKGINPQYIIEKIVRTRIYDSRYWKEECFALTAELLVDKAMELNAVGGTYGGHVKPSPFICLVLKMLQIQPQKDIIIEFIRNEDHKYVRALGAMYMRLTSTATDIYKYLEPLYIDYRKMKRMNKQAQYELTYVDEFIDELLNADRVCDVALPRIQKRQVLEEANELEPRISPLDVNLDDLESSSSSSSSSGESSSGGSSISSSDNSDESRSDDDERSGSNTDDSRRRLKKSQRKKEPSHKKKSKPSSTTVESSENRGYGGRQSVKYDDIDAYRGSSEEEEDQQDYDKPRSSKKLKKRRSRTRSRDRHERSRRHQDEEDSRITSRRRNSRDRNRERDRSGDRRQTKKSSSSSSHYHRERSRTRSRERDRDRDREREEDRRRGDRDRNRDHHRDRNRDRRDGPSDRKKYKYVDYDDMRD